MTVLVIADIANNELSVDLTGKTVNAVSSLGDVTVLCACADAASASSEAAKIKGVNKVLNVSNSLFQNGLAEPMSALIVELSKDYVPLFVGQVDDVYTCCLIVQRQTRTRTINP